MLTEQTGYLRRRPTSVWESLSVIVSLLSFLFLSRFSIDLDKSRELEIGIYWRDWRSLCAIKFLRLEEFIDDIRHGMALQLEPQGLLFAEVWSNCSLVTYTTLKHSLCFGCYCFHDLSNIWRINPFTLSYPMSCDLLTFSKLSLAL